LAIRFAVTGDLRFISHHDTIRLFERALARAAVPVRFSEGFNPRPKLSLPLPRAVGIASDDECLVAECDEPLSPDQARDRLRPQLPEGMILHHVDALESGEKLTPVRATYRIELPPDVLSAVTTRADDAMSRSTIDVERRDHKTGQVRMIDIRPFMERIASVGASVEWTQAVPGSGTARPGEVLQLLGLKPDEWLHRIRRTAIEFA
jgi:radical SAM-linked protein